MKSVLRLGILALLLCRAIAFAGDTSPASSPEWLALLHYQGSGSQITDPAFFLSPTGQSDSQAELDATLAAFANPKSDAQCRFPARLAYLQEALPQAAETFPKVNCPALTEFETKVPFDKISLAFATEHIPNPTTMMGHLFLKIDGTRGTTHPAHSLSFFANLNKVHSTAGFIAGSLFSGTSGVYILEPYRTRRDAYLYQGKRSIWEYELKLTPQQRRMLGLHVWEMKNIDIAYDVRENNCGSAIIRLLMVANPSLENTLYKSYITPADLLRKLNENDQLATTTFVPSQLYTQRNPDGHGGALPPPENVTSKTHATTLNADLTTGTGDSYLTFGIAPAYNKLMNRNAYAEQEYEVNLFNLQLNTTPQFDKLTINKLDVISFQSYLPVKQADASFSSALNIGFENSSFGTETGKIFPKAFGGAGYTVNLFNNTTSAYAMLHGGYSYYKNDNVLSLAPEVGTIIRQGNIGKAQLSYQTFLNSAEYKYDNRFTARQTFFLGKDLNLNTQYEHIRPGSGPGRDALTLGFSLSY